MLQPENVFCMHAPNCKRNIRTQKTPDVFCMHVRTDLDRFIAVAPDGTRNGRGSLLAKARAELAMGYGSHLPGSGAAHGRQLSAELAAKVAQLLQWQICHHRIHRPVPYPIL